MQTHATSVGVSGIGQIHISAKDFERACAFYRNILELPFLFDVPEQKMAFFQVGSVRIYLGVPSKTEYASNSFLYYTVTDIKSAYDALMAKGVSFLSEPHMIHKTEDSQLWMAGFKDSEGNLAQIMQELKIAA